MKNQAFHVKFVNGLGSSRRPRTCTKCKGPMKGHTTDGNRKRVCPSTKKTQETPNGPSESEGYKQGAQSKARRFQQSFGPPPALHISSGPPTSTQHRLRQGPLLNGVDEEEDEKPIIEGRARSVSRVPPDALLHTLPRVGTWDPGRRFGNPGAPGLPVRRDEYSAPTLLVDSDGQTIRHGLAYEYWRGRTQGRPDIEAAIDNSARCDHTANILYSVRTQDIPRILEEVARQGLPVIIFDSAPRKRQRYVAHSSTFHFMGVAAIALVFFVLLPIFKFFHQDTI